jgi:MFS transporter, CP family, cyanate transporter
VRRPDPALVVVLAGISAALHIGKLPPALPALREALHISLLQAGFLLSMVQLAGMTLGLAMGAAADALGARRTMVLGLAILSLASVAGGAATTAQALLLLRGVEGLGFLLTSLPAPGLIRRLVPPARLAGMLGLWGAYMPFGTAVALLVGPAFIAASGWPGWWWLLAAVSAAMAVWLWRAIPDAADARVTAPGASLRGRIARTVGSRGPWLASAAFAVYSGQWLAVIGFLPTIYAQAGLPTAFAAVATALAAAVNMIGNIGSGRLLQRGWRPPVLLQCGYVAMILGAVLAFSPWGSATPGPAMALVRYAGVLLFSSVGGLVPGTLFSLAVRIAPDDSSVSTTVGWMQQWSSFGQFVGPPAAAWAAARAGSWDVMWWITGSMALAGMVIAAAIARYLAGPAMSTGGSRAAS